MAKHSKPLALISVYNKEKIVDFAKALVEAGYDILSTGGTAKHLLNAGLSIIQVSDFTKEKEMLSGRVKTMHPKILGGILYDRNNTDHVFEKEEFSIQSIDIVVVNFYPFYEEVIQKKRSSHEAIEFIDIGGPCLLRAAAKNWQTCLAISSFEDYARASLMLQQKCLTTKIKQELSGKAFELVSKYDAMIAKYMSEKNNSKETCLESYISLNLKKKETLRYGENPQQEGAFYLSIHDQEQHYINLNGKDLSYNNFLDIDAGYFLIKDLNPLPSFAILKHTNPCGVSSSKTINTLDLYKLALKSESQAAFGGVVFTNQTIEANVANEMSQTFFECICAPDFTDQALHILKQKKNLRLVKIPSLILDKKFEIHKRLRTTFSGYLVQENTLGIKDCKYWQKVSGKEVSSDVLQQLHFALTVAKHTKSNAIVIAKNSQTIAVGAGHMSRIDATKHAIQKALSFGFECKEAVVASDAFFPFKDCIEYLAKYGINAIVQPGGSMRDKESIEAASKNNISMYFTKERYFKH